MARATDNTATAVTAASLAGATLAFSSDVLDGAPVRLVWFTAAILLASVIAGGIARFPAPTPLKALLNESRRAKVVDELGSFPNGDRPAHGSRRAMVGLGRQLGCSIRNSERRLATLESEGSSDAIATEVLRNWRARNRLARYRAHSKSAWLSLSLGLRMAPCCCQP